MAVGSGGWLARLAGLAHFSACKWMHQPFLGLAGWLAGLMPKLEIGSSSLRMVPAWKETASLPV